MGGYASRLLAAVTSFIVAAISWGGYPGIVVLMGIESACIPLPSEVIMPFAGYLVYRGELGLLGVSLAGAAGCVLGSLVAYAVGSRGGRPAIERWGRWVLLSPHELERADRWFARYGDATVFFARLLPVVRTFIALPAGVARMPLGRFVWYTFLGSLPWCLALAYAGTVLAERWGEVHEVFRHVDLVVVALLVLLAAAFLGQRLRSAGRSGHAVDRQDESG